MTLWVHTDLGEQELARRCSQGDRLAEDELYRRYAARVYTLCRRYLGDDEEAKDLMQESLIQALDKIQTFNGGKGSLYGWISRIAINKALNQIKRKRWRTVSLDAWAQDTIPEPTEAESFFFLRGGPVWFVEPESFDPNVFRCLCHFVSKDLDEYLRYAYVHEYSLDHFLTTLYSNAHMLSNVHGGVGIFGCDCVSSLPLLTLLAASRN